MSDELEPARAPLCACMLLVLVIGLVLLQLGGLIGHAMAIGTGGSQPAELLVASDPATDEVAAIAAEFRVDESGAATYSVPLYVVPGTAGVAPRLSLDYSSQGGDGPLGKGWSIGGLSSITRCRATREAGDFLNAATPDGNPTPVNFTASDRYCLDGQRLVPSTAACPSAGGLDGVALATEIDTFQRICAYVAGSHGPSFFTVERKDGSISWYGDRDNNLGANRPDGYFETNSHLDPAAALSWAQTRFQDSTGNFIDYLYLENPAGAGTGEHLLGEVRYTGKVALPGQSAGASAPYARIVFHYAARPAGQWSKGYASGGVLTRSRRLESITSCMTMGCAANEQARHYLLTYQASVSGSGLDTLIGLQECRDSTAAVCSAATVFEWSSAPFEFATREVPASLTLATDHFRGYKLGDLDGDGRPDLAVLYLAGSGCTGGSWVVSMLATQDGSGRPTYGNATFNCVPANIVDRGDGAWHLFDYNGDGRDDLFVSSATGQGWRVHPSNGTHFDMATNLIAGLWPAIPSMADKDSQVQLADLNGDGLTDIVYPGSGGVRIRLMDRQAGGFAWGPERALQIDDASLGPMPGGCDDPFNPDVRNCERWISGMPTTKTGFLQMADFNGDAASGLLIRVTTSAEYRISWAPGCTVDPQGTPGTALASAGMITRYQGSGISTQTQSDPCWETHRSDVLHAVVAADRTTSAFTFVNHAAVVSGATPALVLADANGDGLTDVYFQSASTGDWQYLRNTGTWFASGSLPPVSDFRDQVRFADVNGDGRADMLFVVNAGGHKAYHVRHALGDGSYGAAVPLPGGNARICEGSGCSVDQRVPVFADLDGDGHVDFMSLNLGSGSLGMYFSRANARFVARDAITRITNGLGAQTDVVYAPLTNQAVYRRATGTRNATNWGRGAPVLDLLAPAYVVARASSSSPQAGNPAAKATVHYRYANARVQAGGRGFLGFETVDTIDPNQSGGFVVTTTRYAQNFPFAGMPLQTIKKAIAGSHAVPACLDGAIGNSCFATPGQPHPDLGGSWFSNSVQAWEMAGTLASQGPVHVRTLGTEEALRDPYTGETTSKVATAFGYGSHGNVTQTVVDTYTGAEAAPMATVITSNSYGDDVARWRLGRLTSSTVTHRRPGRPDVVRTTGFSYEMTGAATGLLVEERVQPGGSADQALTTRYLHDSYGNRIRTTVCAGPAGNCDPDGLSFQPAASTEIKRYSRVEYDAAGRFPVATYEPFWNGAGAEERRTSRVIARNGFGDAIDAADVNHVRGYAVKGALGRDYYAWTQTGPNATPGNGGASSLTTYRWCTQVACPAGASFRQQIVAQGAPRQWTYFDVLGRAVMQAAESFNAGVGGQDVAAVCTNYDLAGRPQRVSNPFFLPGVADGSGPQGVGNACTAAERRWTVNSFDVLGRPTQVDAPDGSRVASSYAALATTVVDQRGQPTTHLRNGKGELATVTDAAGLATTYDYAADGSLLRVSRNAGNGVISNSFVYDALGRKLQQTDPDTGTTGFEYNALGELTAQVDASGNRIEHARDARGRVWRRTVRRADGSVESEARFSFDTASNGTGQLAAETIAGTYTAWAGQMGMELDLARSLQYDALGRPAGSWTRIDSQVFWTSAEYDALGRPWKAVDVSGSWTKTQYTPRGHAAALCESQAGDGDPACGVGPGTWQRTLATDAWGHVVRERRGDSAAMEVTREYWAETGRIARICAGDGGCQLVDEMYGWDAAGNLSTRVKEQRYLESFGYDSLNRLVEGRLLTRNGVAVDEPTLAIGYDALGNVCSRDGLGYEYGGGAGCGSAGMSAAATTAPAPATATRPLAAGQRPAASPFVRSLLRGRGVQFAPEARYRRYGGDHAPGWAREDQAWGAGQLRPLPGQRFGGAKPRSRAGAARTFAPPPRLTAVASAAPSPTRAATTSAGAGTAPHAVKQTGSGAGATFYYYDDRGNQTLRDAPGTADDRTIGYSLDDRAHEIQLGSGVLERFWYGPDGQRYKRQGGGAITLYLGNVEVLVQGGATTFRRYPGGVALQVVAAGAVQSTRYLFHDQLGSLVRVARADGTPAEGLDYAAFGGRRAYADPHAAGAAALHTPRGFTGHEHLDGTGVIHMNGRIYDAGLGRFLQPDPVIQAPGNAQSWNAYTYVFNNPLAWTDPTGMLGRKERQWLGIAIAVIGTVVTMGMDGGFFAKLGMAMAFGAASGYAATGTLRGAVTGAFTAGLTFGVGWMAQGWDIAGQMAAQAVTGGVLESLQGGSFGHGFVAAGLTAAFMPHAGHRSTGVRAVRGALIGGTISKLTGGKFANGALSGAIMGAMMGARRSSAEQDHQQNNEPDPATIRDDVRRNNALNEVSIDPITGAVTIRVPYKLAPGTSAEFESSFISEVESSLSGYRVSPNFASVASVTVHLYSSSTNPAFTLAECGTTTCSRPTIMGGWTNSTKLMEIRSTAPFGTRTHEFLHFLGLGHQWNITNSIMSYSAHRQVQYMDIHRIQQAYGN